MIHRDCEDYLRRGLEVLGAKADIFLEEPDPVDGYQPEDNTCPHGVTYWALPTAEQREEWRLLETVRISIPEHVKAQIRKKKG